MYVKISVILSGLWRLVIESVSVFFPSWNIFGHLAYGVGITTNTRSLLFACLLALYFCPFARPRRARLLLPGRPAADHTDDLIEP